jgi:hypothetical protein
MAPDDADTRDSDVTDRSEHGDGDLTSHPAPKDDPTDGERSDAAGGRDEDGGELPPVLDVRDSLDRIERDADADVSDELDRSRSLLDRYEARDGETSRASLVDDLDGLVVAMRERLSGDADRYAEGIENRLQTYRDSQGEASETVTVSGPELRDGDDERVAAVGRYEAATATLDATLVNEGERRDGVVRLTLYDEDHDPKRRVLIRESDLSTDERRQVRARVAVPDGAEYYDVTALDAVETGDAARDGA